MTVELELHVPHEVWRATAPLLDKEASKLLSRAAQKLIEREKLFLHHQEAGQSDWEEPTDAYAKRKQREHGTREKFVRTGNAKAALTDMHSKALRVSVNRRNRKLTVSLRKMDKGVNVYSIAQKGRFKGVTLSTGGHATRLSKSQTFERNTLGKKLRDGGEVSNAKKRLLLLGAKGLTSARVSDKPMPITTALSGDDDIAFRVIKEEAEITMRKRGL